MHFDRDARDLLLLYTILVHNPVRHPNLLQNLYLPPEFPGHGNGSAGSSTNRPVEP
jgi:hypothetical protein